MRLDVAVAGLVGEGLAGLPARLAAHVQAAGLLLGAAEGVRRSGQRRRACPQCSNFTGMRPVFGDILISFGVVWYSGMRKWYAGFSLVVAAVGVVPGAKPCKSAGITRVYPGFFRYTRKIPGILPILPILPPRRHSDSL